MVYNAMKLFMEINPRLFDDCSAEYTEHQNSAPTRERSRQEKWERLEEQAKKMKGHKIAGPAGNADKPSNSKYDADPLTQDSQKRFDALKLQDETGAGKESNSVSSISLFLFHR